MGQPQQISLDIDGQDHRDEYEAWREELHQLVGEFSDKHELSFDMMARLLIDLGITSRIIEYVITTAKPSGAGLKLDLDRFRREIDEYMRGCKRDADNFVRETRDAIAENLAKDPTSGEGQDA